MNYKKLILFTILFVFSQSIYIISSGSSSSSSSSSNSSSSSTGSSFGPSVSIDRKRKIENLKNLIESAKKKPKLDPESNIKLENKVKEKEDFVSFVKKQNYLSKVTDIIDIQKLIAQYVYADEYCELKIADNFGYTFTIDSNYLYALNDDIFKVFDLNCLKNTDKKVNCLRNSKVTVKATELNVYGNYLICRYNEHNWNSTIMDIKTLQSYNLGLDITDLLVYKNYLILVQQASILLIWDLNKLICNINNNCKNIRHDIKVCELEDSGFDDRGIQAMITYKKYLICSYYSGTIKIWNLENLEENLKNKKEILVNSFNKPIIPSCIDIENENNFDIAERQIFTNEYAIDLFTFIVRSKEYLLSLHENGHIKIWDISKLEKNKKINCIASYNMGITIQSLIIYENNLIISANQKYLLSWSLDKLIRGSNKMDVISSEKNISQLKVFENYLIALSQDSLICFRKKYHDLLDMNS